MEQLFRDDGPLRIIKRLGSGLDTMAIGLNPFGMYQVYVLNATRLDREPYWVIASEQAHASFDEAQREYDEMMEEGF